MRLLDDFKRGITTSAWVYRDRDSGPGYNCIVTREVRSTWSECFDLAIPKNKPLFAADVDDGHYVQTFGPAMNPLNEWHHLAGTFDSQLFRLGVGGKEVASGNLQRAFGFSDKNPSILGSNTNDQGKVMHDFFVGRIDDLAIHNRPLSANEIALLAKR